MKHEVDEKKLLLLLKSQATLQLLIDNGDQEDLRKIGIALDSIEACSVPLAMLKEISVEGRVLH